MAAMPQAHQVEQVLESLATIKSASSQNADLQPQWRLVSRDGSTTSVDGLREKKKSDCPDCLAGRCGQNAPGCHCSADGPKPTISLDRLTAMGRTPSNATNAAMPLAKPQLFEQVSSSPPPLSKPAQEAWEHELFRVPAPPQSEPNTETSVAAHDVPLENDRGAAASASKSSGDELQLVIDQWPRLAQSTRRAILALVGTVSEADRA